MAVVIETTIGDITVDLFIDERPQTCKNFLKLCKIKYYNFCLFHSVQTNFIAQTGDPTGTGKGGESVYGIMYGEESKYYEGETMPKIKHSKLGLLSMVNYGNNMLGSQFFVTLGTELKSLEEHCVFAEVTEGHDVLIKLNEAICDHQHRPYQDIRITHTVILDDPFDDPPELTIPDASPDITSIQNMNGRIGADEKINDEEGLSEAQLQEIKEEREAKARATILEIVGDLPTADIAPPENVLFVCKLNPVTTDEDLELIFGRFGKVKSCEVIRDQQTGDSLQYAFVEFEDKKSCEQAYFKMDNVLIDDRRIHVDFSQSVSKVKWRGKGRGVEYFDKAGEKELGNRFSDRHSNKKDHHRDRDRVDRERDRDRSERRRGGDDRRRRSDREPNDHRRRDRRKEDGRRREEDSLREEVRDERMEDDRRRRDTREEHRRDEESRDERSEEDRKRRENREDRRDDERKYGSGSSRREERRKEEERKKEEERRKETEKKWNGSERKENTSRHADNHLDGKKHDRIKNNDHEKREEKAKDDKKNDKKDKSLHAGRTNSEKREPNQSEVQVSSDVGKSISSSKEEPALSFIEEKNKNEQVTIKQLTVSTGASDAFLCSKTSDLPDATSQTPSKDKRRKKKRRHSSSSESSSSDSSDSSSSSSSEDYKRKPKRKTTIAKKYYHRGKLVKIIKKKKADSSDSESSDESSDSDRKRKKTKYKKIVKVIKKRKHSSSDDSDSDSSSSSEESDSSKKKSKRKSVKTSKKKKKDSKRNVKKKKKYNSDSAHSDDERSMKSNKTSDSKRHKKEIND